MLLLHNHHCHTATMLTQPARGPVSHARPVQNEPKVQTAKRSMRKTVAHLFAVCRFRWFPTCHEHCSLPQGCCSSIFLFSLFGCLSASAPPISISISVSPPPPPHPSSSVPLYYAWLLLQEYIRKIHEPSFGAATKARGERALHDMQLHDVCFGFRPAYCACMHCTCDPPDCPSLRVKFSAMHVPRCAWLL